MTWDELFHVYSAARHRGDRPSMVQAINDARHSLSAATDNDWRVLEVALTEPKRKWLVAEVFSKTPLPRRLLQPMLRAAAYEADPSFNRYFVEPCVASYGHRVVMEALLDYVENGNDFEKAGAVSALYWAGMTLHFPPEATDFAPENATAESRAAYLELDDIWLRMRCIFLREFVSNANVFVRQSIIPSLNLDMSKYPDELKPLVTQAIEIARNHDDEYIRHRIEVQLGNERLLKPLPRRGSAEP